jgi:hypothetical protein
MFKQFQQKIINILEQVGMAPSPATSNSTGGGALGPNATSLDTLNDASVRDTMAVAMAVAGGTEPPKKGRRKKSKNRLKKPFPMVKRNFPSKTF